MRSRRSVIIRYFCEIWLLPAFLAACSSRKSYGDNGPQCNHTKAGDDVRRYELRVVAVAWYISPKSTGNGDVARAEIKIARLLIVLYEILGGGENQSPSVKHLASDYPATSASRNNGGARSQAMRRSSSERKQALSGLSQSRTAPAALLDGLQEGDQRVSYQMALLRVLYTRFKSRRLRLPSWPAAFPDIARRASCAHLPQRPSILPRRGNRIIYAFWLRCGTNIE